MTEADQAHPIWRDPSSQRCVVYERSCSRLPGTTFTSSAGDCTRARPGPDTGLSRVRRARSQVRRARPREPDLSRWAGERAPLHDERRPGRSKAGAAFPEIIARRGHPPSRGWPSGFAIGDEQ